MAQHILLQQINLKGFQKIYKSIRKNFDNGTFYAQSSLKYQAIPCTSFKENEFDTVFETERSVNGRREIFEVHFDTQNNKISSIYLVK